MMNGDIVSGRLCLRGGVGNGNADARYAEHTDVIVIITDGYGAARIDTQQLTELCKCRSLMDAGGQNLIQRPFGAYE